MSHKRIDKNAKLALDQYKYEMANELGINDIKSGIVDEKGKFSLKKLAQIAKNKMKKK